VARWITFDSLSAEQLMEYQPQETVTVLAGSALQMAIDDPSDSVVVMPGLHAGTALVVRVDRRRPKESMHSVASGFLGLSDEVEFEDEPPAEGKKNWWKRVF
jgi:hypothetical protein